MVWGRCKHKYLNVCVEQERVKIGEEGFHSQDFDVLMTARGYLSMIGKVGEGTNK